MRYFIIFFKFRLSGNKLFNGFGEVSFAHETFPNSQKLLRRIAVDDLESAEIGITNILEISEADYQSWNSAATDNRL